jgi:tetratricopeptide (TPR) repeat protein
MRNVCILAALLIGLQATTPAWPAGQQLSERTYEQLARIHTLLDGERYDAALAALERLKPRAARRPYEQALLLQTYAHVYARQDRYAPAIAALAQCLALDALPVEAAQQARYLLAQLQLATADYPAAAASLEQWFARESEPAPAAHALAGTAYAYSGDHARAIEHLRKAIARARRPEQNWYRQLLAVYYEAGRFGAAAELLQELIRRAPDAKDHWLQLAGVYHELGNDAQSVAVMELAYLRGLLTGEAELVNLARYYLYMDRPHAAAKLLEQALRESRVASTPENRRLLVDAWLRAREPEQALAAADRAQALAPGDAELHLLRAQLQVEQENWSAVIEATNAALAAQGMAATGRAWLLQGYAHYQKQAWQPARASFERARGFEETRDQAVHWLEQLDAERRLAAGAGQVARFKSGS